jgi:hypothetical protein
VTGTEVEPTAVKTRRISIGTWVIGGAITLAVAAAAIVTVFVSDPVIIVILFGR